MRATFNVLLSVGLCVGAVAVGHLAAAFLNHGTTYFWRAREKDALERWSAWSQPFQFTVDTSHSTPTPTRTPTATGTVTATPTRTPTTVPPTATT